MSDPRDPLGPAQGGQQTTERPPTRSEHSDIGVSRGFAAWLRAQGTSLAFTSYQSNRLFLIGVMPDGTVSVHQQLFPRAMGLWWEPNRLTLASLTEIWRLENVLGDGELAEDRFDVKLVPRQTYITGNADVHEIAVDSDGNLIFVATDLSSLATLDPVHGLRPIWKPPFISEVARGDRCHMNGLGMLNGRPKYVTCVSQTDVPNGWHGRPLPNGVVVDVESGRNVSDRLAMPHSPRAVGNKIYALDSGRGFLVEVDPQTGELNPIVFCPGFLRGLAIVGDFAVLTVSKPRYGTFESLPIGDEMERRGFAPLCAVLIVDLVKGEIVEWLRIEGYVQELFTVVLMPGINCPSSVGPTTAEYSTEITFDPEIRPLG
jgi:uncharacterized protein (TIGR03032 family)